MTLAEVPSAPGVEESNHDAGLQVSARGLVGRRMAVAPDTVRQVMLPSTWT